MSQAIHEAIELGDLPKESIGTGGYQSQPTQGQNSQGESEFEFTDSSGPLFSIYLKLAEEEDKKIAERWRADAGGILIFAGLFSAAVAQLVVVSIRDLKPHPHATSDFYLENIYGLLANPDASRNTSVPSLPAKPPPFSPTGAAIWVNSLWFLSLTISLTSALLATLQLLWADRYILITQSSHSPHKRARIRAYLDDGLRKTYIPWMVTASPALLHLSLFLFGAGLVLFLYNINVTVTVHLPVLYWIGWVAGVYAFITLIPLFVRNSPYYTPLSSVAWFLYFGTLYVFCQTLGWITASNLFSYATCRRFGIFRDKYRRWLVHGIEKAAEESAMGLSPEIDGRSLIWTLKSLNEDDQLERFFAALPGFCNSKVVADPLGLLVQPNREMLSTALIGLVCRTLSSNLIPDPVKMRRVKVCAEAMKVASLPITPEIFNVLYQCDEWGPLLTSVEFGLFLANANHKDRSTAYYIQITISNVIASAQEHDARWFELATGQLGVPGNVLRRYLAHGDSALLANCIHIVRYTFRDYSQPGSSVGAGSRAKTLKLVSRLDIQSTLPELQHELCALWNEIVRSMSNTEDPPIKHASVTILGHIWHLYLGLHEGTDSAPTAFSASTTDHNEILHRRSSYPLCDILGHCQPIDSASQICDVAIGGTAKASSSSSFIFPYDDTTLTIEEPTMPDSDIPSRPSPGPDRAGIHLSDASSLVDVPAISQQPAWPPPVATSPHPTPLGRHYYPAASLTASSSRTTHGIVGVTSSTASPYGGGRAPPRNGQTATTRPTVPDALSSPFLTPTPSHVLPGDSPSSVESAPIRFGRIPHEMTPPASARMSSHSPAVPPVPYVLDRNVLTSFQTLGTHGGSRNAIPPIRMEETPVHSFQGEPSTPDVFVASTWRPESRDLRRRSTQPLNGPRISTDSLKRL